MAGLKNGGFLTEEERQLIRQGQMRCSHQNIPLVGPRAEEVVRSSEVKFMVRWIIPFDRQMNKYVSISYIYYYTIIYVTCVMVRNIYINQFFFFTFLQKNEKVSSLETCKSSSYVTRETDNTTIS